MNKYIYTLDSQKVGLNEQLYCSFEVVVRRSKLKNGSI